ncbi:helix-turn-helix domain-containing protein [Acinetobacter haemolyticus]|uniref:AraC family transcriptional regulator n=1 Tax=Acinetobacter haemolyticus TaxID=29430 RepID=UPI001331D761|nr:AraC family transcriptional regulator [Acinetobacter haemolyticus]NAR17237.1 helix-turn-helix domain-containing protein [Acinetobacter haemolyticus]NAR35833.1 helix-turn-helix domain-containing protein [Acinetobacter haemolyticus]QHI19000.1 AraC family transcriptional regulator [Acinetobacter haemolyticus]
MSVKIIIGYLRLLNRVLQQEHIDLSKVAVPELWQDFYSCLENPDQQDFDVERYAQLLQAAQPYFSRPITLVLAERANLQDLGLMGYLASTSLDLQQALQLLQRYYSLIFKQTNLEQLNVQQFSDYIQIVWSASYPDYREMYELNLALLFKIAQSIVQDTLHPPQMIQFGYTPHTALFHFEKFYGCPIQVQSGQYAIRFSNQILKAKSIAADQQLNQVLSTQAQQSLNHVTSFEIQQQQLRQKIQSFIEQGLLQQEEVLSSYVAKHLHCSERTLQRQLKAYHLNFQDILDQYRLEQSKLYLQQGKSFSEIAERLNYADQSAFGRAFKRWTGVTPKQFLKSL